MLVLAATGTGAARGQDAAQSPPGAKDDIVVVGRKRPDPAAGIKPDDTLPDTLIKGFGADTVGDVLARLRARSGSSEFSIVVNGRPVGSLDAIEALPPEALAKIDILPASAAGQLGVPGDARIINLQLRPRFRSTALEAEATQPSGGSPGQSLGVRHARISTIGEATRQRVAEQIKTGGTLDVESVRAPDRTGDAPAKDKSRGR